MVNGMTTDELRLLLTRLANSLKREELPPWWVIGAGLDRDRLSTIARVENLAPAEDQVLWRWREEDVNGKPMRTLLIVEVSENDTAHDVVS